GTTHHCGARAEGTDAVAQIGGGGMQHPDPRHRHAQRIGRDLSHDGLDALADRGRPDIDRDRAVGLDFHAGVFARTRTAAFDEAGDTHAVIAAVYQPSVQAHLLGPAELRNAEVEGARGIAAVALSLAVARFRDDRRAPLA